MRRPDEGIYGWERLDEVGSTQAGLRDHVVNERPFGVVFTEHQTAGSGRFGRKWISERGDSLTVSYAFHAYADHPRPHLIGMAVAIAAAATLHCQLQWPNDITFKERKLGGVLTEVIVANDGRKIPVVGVGLNLNQTSFPDEIAHRATSALMIHGGRYEPARIAQKILQRLEDFPEPTAWSDIQPMWEIFDNTPGKQYKLADEVIALAIGIGSEGQLICSVNGESQGVFAADAIFGAAT